MDPCFQEKSSKKLKESAKDANSPQVTINECVKLSYGALWRYLKSPVRRN